MNKTILVILTAVMMVLPVFHGFAEYDQEAVVKVMRDNVAALGKTRSAIGSQDFHEAAAALWKIASGMRSIQVYAPPRGSKADWDRTVEAVIEAAYRGIGACGDNNVDALSAALTELQALNRQGHTTHKP